MEEARVGQVERCFIARYAPDQVPRSRSRSFYRAPPANPSHSTPRSSLPTLFGWYSGAGMGEDMEVVYHASPHHPDRRPRHWFELISGDKNVLSGNGGFSLDAGSGPASSSTTVHPCKEPTGCWAVVNVTNELSPMKLFIDVLDSDGSGTLSRKEAERLRQLLYSHYGPEVTMQVTTQSRCWAVTYLWSIATPRVNTGTK